MNGSIDSLKLIGAAGVVLFHVDGSLPGYGGLIIFVFLLGVFQKRAQTSTEALAYIKSRRDRLIVPWLFWFGVYGLYNLAIHGTFFRGAGEGFQFAHLLAGPWIGLWFLPFAFIVGILGLAVSKVLDSKVSSAAQGLLGLLLLGVAHLLRTLEFLPPPFAQWVHALPSFIIGIAFATIRRTSGGRLAIAYLICIVSICFLMRNEDRGLYIPYGYGLAACLALPIFSMPRPPWLKEIGEATFGIYLVHILLFSLLRRIMGSEGLAVVTLTILLSLGLSLLVRRIPIVSRFV